MIQRARPMARGKPPRRTPVKKVNRERKAREFARCYHSKERVRFVKSLGCVVCMAIAPIFGYMSAGQSHNAHTENGGRGRKGDYTTIVPLCAAHHRRYDEHRPPCDNSIIRQAIKGAAVAVERAWRSFQEQRDTQEEHTA